MPVRPGDEPEAITVDYEEFIENPRKAIRKSVERPIVLVDKTGRRRGYIGQVTLRDEVSDGES